MIIHTVMPSLTKEDIMDEFVLSNGMRLCCEEIGAGRPVICLHGWTSDHKVFVEPAQALADKAHFIL